jgi:hypothetical protein
VLADIAIDDAFDHEKARVWSPAEGAVALFPLLANKNACIAWAMMMRGEP